MAEQPLALSPFGDLPHGWVDLSLEPKWRTFADPSPGCAVGHAVRHGDRLVWSVSPGEWTVLGARPEGIEVVDLTHVRAVVQIPHADAVRVLPKVCALDFDERSFPQGAAARTAVAAVATEIIRQPGVFLLVISRSYGAYITNTLQAGCPG